MTKCFFHTDTGNSFYRQNRCVNKCKSQDIKNKMSGCRTKEEPENSIQNLHSTVTKHPNWHTKRRDTRELHLKNKLKIPN